MIHQTSFKARGSIPIKSLQYPYSKYYYYSPYAHRKLRFSNGVKASRKQSQNFNPYLT